ncbi:hypothetical protein T11_9590 [Trichinella zimbabwensis]|uniref:Uncharacterized protein n=1 Tax=Trichinella zimbabwensis TaxID=268475 RepID=A0A0V1HV13_9BILA|nr:hypothetical protein T11_9590 [Trichinella zimbabwensis]
MICLTIASFLQLSYGGVYSSLSSLLGGCSLFMNIGMWYKDERNKMINLNQNFSSQHFDK